MEYFREEHELFRASLRDFLHREVVPNIDEWEKEKRKAPKQTSNSNWTPKGPINTPIILANGKKRGNGRVNCVAFDPFNEDIIWIGSCLLYTSPSPRD